MNKQEIFEKLLSLIKDMNPNIDIKNISMETKVFSDLNLDSISLLYLALQIEECFKYKLTNDDVSNISTVSDLIELILNNNKNN